MAEWKQPPLIKICEALGTIADGRVHIEGEWAQVYSSSRGKLYVVKYDSHMNAIMANDNGSYWQGYLGYPSIAYLMLRGVVKYDERVAGALKGIKWKALNAQFRNDYEKAVAHILTQLPAGIDAKDVEREVQRLADVLAAMKLRKLSPRVKPPQGL